jgi:hypothetical protein
MSKMLIVPLPHNKEKKTSSSKKYMANEKSPPDPYPNPELKCP